MPSETGIAAAQQRRWREAHELLAELAESGGAGATDLVALSDAAHAVGDYELALQACQDAHAAYLDAGDRSGAAATAVQLTNVFIRRGELAVCAGWASTAEQLLVGEPETVAHGLVSWVNAMFAIVAHRDLDAAGQLAEETTAIGNRFEDRDIQALALALRAEVAAKRGDAAVALPLVDEAMARAIGGRLRPWVSCHVLCRSLIVCQDTGDVGRGKQWAAAARAACDREGMTPLSGDCRVHHACLLNQQGEWSEAEQEAQTGCEELKNDLLHLGIASYELGELALRRGEFAKAEAAFERANELGTSPQPGLALLRLAQGKARAAASTIATALDDETFAFRRALLLATQVEIALGADDPETARGASEALAALETSAASESVAALVATAQGAVALAEGELEAACSSLRDGSRRWTKIGMPYPAARARRLLADAYEASGDPDSAELELKAARSAFERLGAEPDARAARAALRRLLPETSDSQRVTRAFMFTDIVGSTPLVEALGDDAWGDLLRWHDGCLRAEFAAHQGKEAGKAGDGFFVAFSAAGDAMRCATSIQRKLRDHRRTNGFAPQVRIGVHVDDATADGDDYLGLGVHTAARIGAQAQAGEVLASRVALAAAGEEFEAGEPRTSTLKGIEGPVELLPVSWD